MKKDSILLKAGGACLLLLALAALTLPSVSCRARKPGKKQIILISIDTLRGDHLDAFGYPRATAPYLTRLIKDATYFRDANPNGCWTMPSHVSLLTGTLPSRHGVNMDWKSRQDGMLVKPNRSIRFLAEMAQSRGLRTFKFAALPNELGFGRGFDRNERGDPFLSNLKFKEILDQIEASRQEDFFLFIHTWMVHAPYANTRFLDPKGIGPQTRGRIDQFRRHNQEQGSQSAAFAALLKENNLFNRRACVELYDGGIQYADQYIGRLIQHAKRMGMYKDLMIIVTSDHGEHFSEHYDGKFYDYHGLDFLEEFIRVPLIIKYPGGRLTGTRDDPVSLVDVVPTVLDYYGWEIPAYVQGRSLLGRRRGSETAFRVSEAISLSNQERKMIRSRELKFIVTMEEPYGKARADWKKISQRRLFDLKNDPGETRNLLDDPRFLNLGMELERRLREIIRDSAGDRWETEPTRITSETLEQMKALGYL